MYFKKMTGAKCYLSPIDPNDAEKYAEWLNDWEVIRFITAYNKVINADHEREFLLELSKEHTYAIVDLATNELIGNCGFMNMNHPDRNAEVGIFIGNKNFWGKGFGSEALALTLDYGFKALNLHSVFLRTLEFNERAIASYKKTGFKIIGRRRESVMLEGRAYDAIYMDILRDEFYEKFHEQ
jgi:RimJ/RimL family protein N-acetyltransferase